LQAIKEGRSGNLIFWGPLQNAQIGKNTSDFSTRFGVSIKIFETVATLLERQEARRMEFFIQIRL